MNSGKVAALKLSEIKPYWRNPRINEDSVELVAKSIEDYGYNQFIVVDPNNVIIAGHTRFKALNRLEWKDEVAVIVADLPAKKAKQYRIADNASAEKSTWDDAMLIQELRETELPDMQIYFDRNLKDLIEVSTGTTGWTDITEAGVDAALLKEENKIVELTGKRESSIQDVICPHCGEEFSVV
jgi:hypothetical protein